MQKLNYSTAKIKNNAGVFEGIPALKGESVYDIAVRTGYIGTEDDFIKEIISDGWVNACLNLENKKADVDYVNNAIDNVVISKSITLPAADWYVYDDGVSIYQEISVEGVTTTNIIVVSPDPSDVNYTAYKDSGIRCRDQGDGKLLFQCENIPEIDVTVNVIITS